ncbi:MAG: hypothetical protein ABJC33_11555 [Betaproteobacteria bacterium]
MSCPVENNTHFVARCRVEGPWDALPAPEIPRAEVIDELYAAVALRQPTRHDGRWGMATLEACLALLQSAREAREILVSHQVAAIR